MSEPSLPSDVDTEPEESSWEVPSESDIGVLSAASGESDTESVELPSDVDDDPDAEIPSPRVALTNGTCVPSPQFVQQWLRNGAPHGNQIWGIELYSPPRVLAASLKARASIAATVLGLFSLDIMTGWNFDVEELKTLSLQVLTVVTVPFLYLSPPCTMFSSLQVLWNRHRMPQEVWDRRWQQSVAWVEHAMAAIRIQLDKGMRFMFEHPSRASSWRLACVQDIMSRPNIYCISFDMCAFDMRSPLGQLVKKRTIIMTNDSNLATLLRSRQCSKDHEHRRIEGSELGHSMSRWCQAQLCHALASCLDDQH